MALSRKIYAAEAEICGSTQWTLTTTSYVRWRGTDSSSRAAAGGGRNSSRGSTHGKARTYQRNQREHEIRGQALGDSRYASQQSGRCQVVATVRANVTLDWTMRENVRAHLRVLVKRIRRRYGYPPDKQEKATQTVLEQAEVLSAGWAVQP